jgi:nucleoside phosphorylase
MPEKDEGDGNSYACGRIGGHNIVIACFPVGVYGTCSAATVAKDMLHSFPLIRFGLMVGIGGGVPSLKEDIRLGDVVVSKPMDSSGGVIQYDHGKNIAGQFQITGSLNKPPLVLLTALSKLIADHMRKPSKISHFLSEMVERYALMGEKFCHQGPENDLLFDASYDHKDGQTCDECEIGKLVDRSARRSLAPFIHYGLIASANQVMKHGATRDKLREELKVLCFEMEAAGLMDTFPCLVIRGICDYADSHKNKRWQEYAAATAAAYAKELLNVIPTRKVAETDTAVEVMGELAY